MSGQSQVRICETCKKEYVSDAEWDAFSLGDCPSCVAAEDERAMREDFDYGVSGPRFSNQTPSQGAHGNG